MSDTENDVRLDETDQEEMDAAGPKPALSRMSNRIASTALGQSAIRRMHGILETIEDTAKWSCPITPQLAAGAGGDDVAAERPQMQSLSRPMPWVFFLPALMVMRIVRFSISTVSILLGWGPVGPSDIVHWLQNQRRSLRAMRFQGLRDIRVSEEAAHVKPLHMISTMFLMLRGICRRNELHVKPEVEGVVIGSQSQNQGRTSTGKRRRSVDADEDDHDENVIDALNRTYTENETDVTFELDAVSGDSQLSSAYESVSDSGCSELATDEICKKSIRRKRRAKKQNEEINAVSKPQDLIGTSSGFESINGNPATQSETDPTSSPQYSEDELNTTAIAFQPAQKDEIKLEFGINQSYKKHQVSPIRESDERTDTDEMELTPKTPKTIIDDCDERKSTTDEQKVITKIFNHKKELKPFQRHKSNRNKKSKVPASKN